MGKEIKMCSSTFGGGGLKVGVDGIVGMDKDICWIIVRPGYFCLYINDMIRMQQSCVPGVDMLAHVLPRFVARDNCRSVFF